MGEGKKRRSGEPLREKNDQKRRKEDDDPPSPAVKMPSPVRLPDDTLLDGLDAAEMEMVCQGGHKIKKMLLQNFMCHRRLELEFGDRITFITGKNGSGKSATMNALTAVFGGKQSDTGKKGSVTGWIRRGPTGRQNAATIKITISNEGPTPYKPEVFGSDITFERVINKNASSYFLTGAISRREKVTASHIKLIASFFKIQATNPFTVMTQETIKNFMKGNPKKLYEHFSRGTSIEELKSSYMEMKDLWHGMQMKEHKRKIDLDNFRQARREAKALLNQCEKKRKAEERQKELNSLEKWTSVPPIQAQLKKAQKKLENYTKVAESYEQKINKKKEDIENETVECLERDMQKVMDESEEYQKVIKKVLAEKKLFESRRDKDNATAHELEDSVARATRKMNSNKKALNAFKKDPQVEKQAKLEEDREQLRARTEEHRRELGEMEPKLLEAKRELENAKDNVASAEQEAQRYKTSFDRLLEDRREIQRRSSAKENKFGAFAKEVSQAISRERWDHRPVGPVGDHVNMDERFQQYAGVVEKLLGHMLMGYIVYSERDKATLNRIIGQLYKNNKPQIYKQDFVRESFRRKGNFKEVTHADYPSALKALKIDDVGVENLVISWAYLNSFLLCDDEQIAQEIAQSESQNPAGKRYSTIMTTYGGEFKYRGGLSGRSQLLKAQYLTEGHDYKSALEKNDADRKYAKRLADSFLADKQKWRKKAEEISKFLSSTSNRKMLLRKKVDEAAKRDAEFDRQLREIIVGADSRTQHLMTEIAHSQQEIDELNIELENLKEKMAYELKTINEKIAAVKEEEDKLDECQARYQELNRKEQTQKKTMKNLKNELKELAAKKKEFEEKVAEWTRNSEAMEKDLAECVRIAEGHCERPKDPLTKEQLKDEREKIVRDLKLEIDSSDKQHRDYERHHQQMEVDYKKKKQNVIARLNACGKLESAVNIRLKEVRNLVAEQAATVSRYFKEICRINKYEGEAKIEPETFDDAGNSTGPGSITINMSKIVGEQAVDIEAVSQMSKKGNTATLSGGERSISTVILLISIWYATSSPFRCIDEFDVFMDANHKHMATRILCTYAVDNPSSQVIFLTPQGLSDDQATLRKEFGDIFQFLKMKDPTRAQQD